MRSYSYSNGIWKEIVDPFPTVTSSISDDFLDALKRQGFHASHYMTKQYDCMLGKFTLYARDHEKLGITRKEKEFEYDFLCVLNAPSTRIRVWISDLPSLLLFFREVEVRHEQENELPNVLSRFFHDDDVQGLIILAEQVMRRIQDEGFPVQVKPPKPPQRRP